MDDQRSILDGLLSGVPFGKIGFDQVLTAGDAAEAWEIIRSFYSYEAQSAMTNSGSGSFPLKTDVFEVPCHVSDRYIINSYNLAHNSPYT